MSAASHYIPPGFHTITPTLAIDGAAKAIAFYKTAFGAEEVGEASVDKETGMVWHAELRIGDSLLFVNDVMGMTKSSTSLWLYVPNVDASYKRAIEAGATSSCPPSDMFWGDRMSSLNDPFGQRWTIATHIKDLTPAQIKVAADEFRENMKKAHPQGDKK